MKRYPKNKNIDWSKFKWTKFKIIVPTKLDEKEVRSAFRHFHNSKDIDTDYVTVNQLAHQYLDNPGCHIIVDKTAYETLNKTIKD
jgi:uncharacterized protein YktA (UPF0223 family)